MICIISDTHENVRMIDKAVHMIQELKPELVVHCGDIISPPVLAHFAGLPMRCVFGNNDGERTGLKKKCEELGFGEIADSIEIVHDGKKIFVNHGTDPRVIDKAAAAQIYDYIFTGHTHRRRDEKSGKCRIINPGALFMASEYTFACLDVARDALEIRSVQ